MRKFLAVATAIVATAVVAVGAAGAGDANPLFEDSGFACGVLDRDGSTIVTTDSQVIWYQSGKVVLRCNAQGTPGDTVVTFSGFPCFLGPFGMATHSKNVIRREGHIQLVCTADVNPGNVVDAAVSSAGYGA